jgi:HSP20 family molecular chaperone IbpA
LEAHRDDDWKARGPTTDDGHYEVHAEIPGVDPATDIEITVDDGLLGIIRGGCP